MRKDIIPKWQREVQSFLGVKSCLLLEGNVYDEYPRFSHEDGKVEFMDIENLDQTLLNLVEEEHGCAVFCDPIYGFYCYAGGEEQQRDTIEPLLKGYKFKEIRQASQGIVYFCPTEKAGSRCESQETNQQTWMSEIVRNAIAEYPGEDSATGWIVFILNFASRLDACNLRQAESNEMFLNLMAAITGSHTPDRFSNMVIMIVDKYNDVPAWIYLNNPHVRSISISVPDRNTRRLYLENVYGALKPFSVLGREDYDAGIKFVAETEGMQCQELEQILKLAGKMHMMPDDIHQAFQLYKYGVLDNPWDMLEDNILSHIKTILNKRVKGQTEALDKVQNVITRAVKGLSGLQHSSSSQKPRGILFLAGPTGVGKTETAKAIAQAIFGDESACIRFDMSEYRLEQSDQKLFGAPPGYVGYEGGGQLTNEVKKHPFSVLLFDEIEKASPTILDKFLQILEDGRMTDNQGNTVYFGETIIIFTSNIGLTKLEYDEYGRSRYDESGNQIRVPSIEIEDPNTPDTAEFREMVTQTLTQGVKNYFTSNGRPELLNRLGEDNIVVFQFINTADAEAICESKLQLICEDIKKQEGIELIVDEVLDFLKSKAVQERANGGRGVGNMLEREFLNPLASCLCEQNVSPTALRCHVGAEKKIFFEVM